jgi:hypothetical protein
MYFFAKREVIPFPVNGNSCEDGTQSVFAGSFAAGVEEHPQTLVGFHAERLKDETIKPLQNCYLAGFIRARIHYREGSAPVCAPKCALFI